MDKSEAVFERLANTTWEVIANAFSENISYGEDAITSVNLLTLKNEALRNFAIQDTRASESTKGCDFEFWIGSNRNGWYRYAIQAKKISVSKERYNSLSHEVAGKPQIDILEAYSAANKAIPLYCLFNYSQRVSGITSGCPKFIDIKELGCSITPSKTVRKALTTRGARTFKWLHGQKETLPWSCLVRCPQISQHWPKNILGFDHKDMAHKELPHQLRLLLKHELQAGHLYDSDLFSHEIDYRPRWVGVLEIDAEENG